MKETDIAWAAGFFDGEGSIYVGRTYKHTKTGTKCYQFKLVVDCTQVERAPLDRFVEMFGGKVFSWYQKGNHPISVWRLTHRENCQNFLRKILPYLMVKAEEATVALTLPLQRTGHRLTADDREFAENVRNKLQLLKLNKKHAAMAFLEGK